MSKESTLAALKNRHARLAMNGKNIQGQGVMRKLERKIRNLKKEIANEQ